MPSYPQLSFTGGEISPHVYARIDLQRYTTAARKMRNFMAHEYGGVSNRPGTIFIDQCLDAAHRSRLIPFSFNTQQNYVLEFSHNKIRIIKDGGIVVYPTGHALAGQKVEITSPYAATDLPLLKFAQNADIMTICHPSYPVHELARSDHHDWVFNEISFTPSLDEPSNVGVIAYGGGSGTNYKYIITAISESGEESLSSSEVTCVNQSNMNTGNSSYNALSWSSVTGATKYNIYRYDDYAGYSFGYLNSTEDTNFNDNGAIEPDVSDAPPQSRAPFDGVDKYPSCVTYYKQRLCFGRSNTYPQHIWMTQTSHYKNMNVSTPSRADDSIEYSIAANQVNEIRHIVPLRDLLILTSGGEWAMTTNGDPVSAETIDFIHESVNGSSHISPLTIQNSILYIDETAQTIRDLFYRFENDGYSGDDLTIFSRHLFEAYKIEEWCFQKTPYNVIWVVRDDGTLLGLTYNRNHQVWGWHRHDTTDGQFESVCSLYEDGQNVLYCTVKRQINGQDVRYIEKFAARFNNDIEEGIFVDSALSYTGTPVSVLSGLDHLEGQTVSILADGNVHPQQVVENGSITLNYTASTIHVGLPITAELETLDAHINNTTSFGQKRSVHNVTLSVKDTRGLWIGSTEDDLVEHKQRQQDHGYTAIPQESGDIRMPLHPSWHNKGRVLIQQRDPLPATILSVIADITLADE